MQLELGELVLIFLEAPATQMPSSVIHHLIPSIDVQLRKVTNKMLEWTAKITELKTCSAPASEDVVSVATGGN